MQGYILKHSEGYLMLRAKQEKKEENERTV